MSVTVAPCDPASPPARALGEALWAEIQRRYGFTAANPFHPDAFTGPVGRFWVARVGDEPVGSVALMPLDDDTAELDVMYVAPGHRGTGVARALLAALEEHARSVGVSVLRLRTGAAQPEALRLYAAAGFTRIPAFGRWVGDETAWCFQKRLDA